MACTQRGSILAHVIGVAACGAAGGLVAWALVQAIGLGGVPGALVAAGIAMAVAFAGWVGGMALLRALGRER